MRESNKTTVKASLRSMLSLLFLLGSMAVASAAPIPVRFPEATVRGFLVLNSSQGTLLASGDFLQLKRGGEVETRTIFQFKDGSRYEEKAVFTEQRTFTLQSYRLVYKGPAFSQDLTATVNRASGKYEVRIKGHKDGGEKVYQGKLDMPPDLYNGMIPIVAKNLRAGVTESVQMIAFTPTPRLIGLDLVPSGESKVVSGGAEKKVIHYVLKPKLGLALKIGATLTGRLPPDNHLWMITTDVPAFIKFEGPLYPEGPIWRIELTAPR